MAILFSCVGNTDPIRNNHDGPMLHILREYQDIRKCILFLTKDMIIKDEDGYYDKPIEALCKLQKRQILVEKIKTQIVKVNDFNAFYDIFKEALINIRTSNPNEKVYVNVTSSTPQMIATLMILLSQNKINNAYAIQVSNSDPQRNVTNTLMDIDKEITENKDNYESTTHRASEIEFITMQRNQEINKILSLLKIYDYNAIVEISKDSYINNKKAFNLIKHMKYRSDLDFVNAKRCLMEENLDINSYFPFFCNNYLNVLLEYFLKIQVLAKNKQLNDFVIRLRIITKEVQLQLIKSRFKVDVLKEYCDTSNYLISDYLDEELKEYLGNTIGNKQTPINTRILNEIVEFYNNESHKIENEVIEFLVKIDMVIKMHRNNAAHEMEIITEKMINKTISIVELLKGIKKIIVMIYPKVDYSYFNIYDVVNDEIRSYL